MSKTYFIPGLRPVQRDGGVDCRELVREHPRVREFHQARERRRRESSETFASGFDVGDREVFRGESVVVEHREFDQHSGTERLWLRGDKTGTQITEWKKTDHGTAEISRATRTMD